MLSTLKRSIQGIVLPLKRSKANKNGAADLEWIRVVKLLRKMDTEREQRNMERSLLIKSMRNGKLSFDSGYGKD